MSLLTYYLAKKLNPVPIKFSTSKNLEDHFLKRKNLIQNHLKLPLYSLHNKDYLEFGCNGAENACFFSTFGSNIYLAEPNQSVHNIIKKNFKKIKKNKSLKLLSNQNLEKFKLKKKFDFVVAEGFLNTSKKRNDLFLKLSNFLKKKSILITNYDDVFGGVFELIKSFILLKICNIYQIERFSDQSFKIAKQLFEKEFKKLNTSRSFYAWWADQLVNPYASKTWSLKDILKQANKNKLSLYSTSPIFNELDHFQWYKNTKNYSFDLKRNNALIYNEWKKSLPSIILGKKQKKLAYVSDKVVLEIEKFSNKLSNFIANPKKHDTKLKLSVDFIKLIKKCGKKKLIHELLSLINLINNKKKPDTIINFYKNTTELNKTWGSLLHYVALIKE